jgi:hypothetical protein
VTTYEEKEDIIVLNKIIALNTKFIERVKEMVKFLETSPNKRHCGTGI